MKLRIGASLYLQILLLAALPVWSQVAPSAAGGDFNAGDDALMETPPPVSGSALPTAVGAEERSNFFNMDVFTSAGYADNLYPGESGGHLSETTYSIAPRFTYDQTASRQHRLFTYSPGFIFYQPSNQLNEMDHNALIDFEYRITSRTTLGVNEAFEKSSTAYGIPGSSTAAIVAGTASSLPPGIVAPFGDRITNMSRANFSYQFSEFGMVGGAGTFSDFRYPGQSTSSGLYNSDSRGGSAFYNRRISASQYAGLSYEYTQTLSYRPSVEGDTKIQMLYAFYTVYPQHKFSISFSGGPQHYATSQTSYSTSMAWEPLVMASLSWEGTRANIAFSYSREVTSGGGLFGVFVSSNLSMALRWQLARSWTAGTTGSYAVNKAASTLPLFSGQNGRSIMGNATLEHPFNDHLKLRAEYDRLHQSYGNVEAIASDPDSDRETVSLIWQISRPVGR